MFRTVIFISLPILIGITIQFFMKNPLLRMWRYIENDYIRTPCERRSYDRDSFVCVCTGSSCDFAPTSSEPTPGNFIRIMSSKDKYRFGYLEVERMVRDDLIDENAAVITINRFPVPEEQTIIKGFGGAFTDAAGINIVSLTPKAQDQLMKSYFGEDGIEYNLCRVPIAGTDFSTHPYSYDDVEGDVDLVHFNLTAEDFDYKIPLIKRAMDLSNRNLLLFASPWAPPYWMKENQMSNGKGGLLLKMWQPYANYLVKFIDEYKKNGVPIWGITPQNEPMTGFQDWPWNTCAWSAEEMRDWLKNHFGPTMAASGYKDVECMISDQHRSYLPGYAQKILEDPEVAQYVHGTACHWYDDMHIRISDTSNYVSYKVLDQLHESFPNKYILYTESCEGFYGDTNDRVHLGSWIRAEKYASNIIEDLNHHVTGWVDWNMALHYDGGPNWANNPVDAPILVNATADEFLKQPTFYAMGHFSKYIKRNGIVLPKTSKGNTKVESVSIRNPNGEEAVVLLNRAEDPVRIIIEDKNGPFIDFDMHPRSIETVIYDTSFFSSL